MNYGIGNVKGAGGVSNTMLTTTTDATENSGTYTLALTYLSETPKVNDYVVYVNSGNLTTLYQVSAVDSTNATLEKIGDIGGGGGGNQLYQHNIVLSETGYTAELDIFITNDNPNQMTLNDVKTWLNDKGYNAVGSYYRLINGYRATTDTPTKYIVGGLKGVFNNNGTIRLLYMVYSGSQWDISGLNFTTLEEDKVIPL